MVMKIKTRIFTAPAVKGLNAHDNHADLYRERFSNADDNHVDLYR